MPPFPVEESYPKTIGGREMQTHIDWVAPTFILSLAGLPVASVPAGLDGSFAVLDSHGAVYGLSERVTGQIFDPHGSVDGLGLDIDGHRNAKLVVHMPPASPPADPAKTGPNLHLPALALDFDFEPIKGALARCRLARFDVNFVAVPGFNPDRAVRVLDRKPPVKIKLHRRVKRFVNIVAQGQPAASRKEHNNGGG